jgi:hypothetical protein
MSTFSSDVLNDIMEEDFYNESRRGWEHVYQLGDSRLTGDG